MTRQVSRRIVCERKRRGRLCKLRPGIAGSKVSLGEDESDAQRDAQVADRTCVRELSEWRSTAMALHDAELGVAYIACGG